MYKEKQEVAEKGEVLRERDNQNEVRMKSLQRLLGRVGYKREL